MYVLVVCFIYHRKEQHGGCGCERVVCVVRRTGKEDVREVREGQVLQQGVSGGALARRSRGRMLATKRDDDEAQALLCHGEAPAKGLVRGACRRDTASAVPGGLAAG